MSGRLGAVLPGPARGAGIVVRVNDRTFVHQIGRGHVENERVDLARVEKPVQPTRSFGAAADTIATREVEVVRVPRRVVDPVSHQGRIDERFRRMVPEIQPPDLPVGRRDERGRSVLQEHRVIEGGHLRWKLLEGFPRTRRPIDRSNRRLGRAIDAIESAI